VPLPATETLRDKNGEATEEPPSRDEGEAASHSPVPSPTTEEQSLRDNVGEGWLDIAAQDFGSCTTFQYNFHCPLLHPHKLQVSGPSVTKMVMKKVVLLE